jgi:hypothetical protein
MRDNPSHRNYSSSEKKTLAFNYSSSLMRAYLEKKSYLFKTKNTKQTTSKVSTVEEDINSIIRWKVDRHIEERPKLLIWSESTYKQLKKKKKEEVGSKRGRREE